MNEKEAFCNISFNSMLPLDMLAEVASETLRSDLTLSFKSDFGTKNSRNGIIKSCSQKRSATSTEILNLDQIRVLSDKMLLEMFSESSADEIRRVFKYKCYLMPDNCDEIFSSFGNETKARLQMKSHLLSHIAQLLADANAPGISCKSQFFAEPLSARKRRLQESSPKRRKKIKTVPKKNKPVIQKKVVDKKSVPLKPHKNSKTASKFSKNISNQAMAANVFVSKAHTRLKKTSHLKSTTSKEKENSYCDFPPTLQNLYLAIQNAGNSNTDVQDDINIINNCVAVCQEIKSKSEIWNSVLNDSFTNNMTNLEPSAYLEISTEKNSEKDDLNDQNSVQDSTNYLQHDHTYTSVNGKTFVNDNSEVAKIVKERRKIHHRCSGVAQQLIIPTPPFPYVYEPLLPHISEIKELGATNRRSCDKCAVNSMTSGCRVNKCSSSSYSSSYSNKSVRYRRVNKLVIPEEFEPDTEDDENVPVSFMANFVDDRFHEPEVILDETIPDQDQQLPVQSLLVSNNVNDSPHLGERKLALKCIRALRMKKKDERGPLVCQICNGKRFTAQATLMYHYRSHAGIKPFACSVCDATFTRQHSLNYHMLIHNNKSRFACEECGRSFRHPSHYKEHLRRHTGETPFHCTDCNLRFKTRNTYKRHLKTRHGKILTARGIRMLSDEEFDKVRTMPRRRSSKQSLMSSPSQKTQWSDLTFTRLSDMKSNLIES